MKEVPRESEAQDVLNAKGLGIYGLIVGISSRVRGRHIT
jgi:hypothetical protein